MPTPKEARWAAPETEWEEREVEIIEQNGNLILIEDKETGEPNWVCPWELNQ